VSQLLELTTGLWTPVLSTSSGQKRTSMRRNALSFAVIGETSAAPAKRLAQAFARIDATSDTHFDALASAQSMVR